MSDLFWIVSVLACSLLLTGVGLIKLLTRRDLIRHPWCWMSALFVVQTCALVFMGMADHTCPIWGISGVLFFMGWALNGFYLLLGMQYRMSVLGVFTSPAIAMCMIASWLTYGMDTPIVSSGWLTWHAGFAMLAYGAFGLSFLAGFVYLIQNHLLKKRRIVGLSRLLPHVRTLQTSIRRLVLLGTILLFASLLFAFFSGMSVTAGKAVIAWIVSIAYGVLLGVIYLVGMPGRLLAWLVCVLYIVSLTIFFFLK